MAARLDFITPEAYLAQERLSDNKSEYVDGAIYAMSGASEAHNLIVMNTGARFNLQLADGPCRVYPSDLKIGIPGLRKFYYPDITVVCEEPKFADENKDVLLNPLVIIEVLSESTAAYDRGKKFQSYQDIPSFQEYILISQDDPLVERFVRQRDESWIYTRFTRIDDLLVFSAINCSIDLKDIYAKTGINS
ncbi:MAG: Uma2 family endonuclease [Acidobacteria bacterium]|nr:Uma2 family endonuclease [Acidobacteriota bacterium]